MGSEEQQQPAVCDYCEKPIENSWIGTGTGKAHIRCYHLAHPPRLATSLLGVLRGPDPVLGASVVIELTPLALVRAIVARYNRELLAAHARRTMTDEELRAERAEVCNG